MSAGKLLIPLAGAVASIILLTHFALSAHAGPSTESQSPLSEARSAVEVCSNDFVGSALELSAGTGSGEALDQANDACGVVGAQYEVLLAGLEAAFARAIPGAISPEAQAIAEGLLAQLGEVEREHISTLSVEERARFLNGLAVMGGE